MIGGHALRVSLVGDCAACGVTFDAADLRTVAGESYCRGCVPDESPTWVDPPTCRQCGAPLSPVAAMLGPTCGRCCRANHRAATGGR